MPSAARSITRLQDADDLTFAGGAGDDTKHIAWDNGTSKFIMASVGDHATLSNLDYASAAHTGFARTGGTNTFSGIQTFGTSVVINEDGDDADTRIEGNTLTNLFYVDAGNDRIGIGTATPAVPFHLVSSLTGSLAKYEIDNSAGVFVGVANSDGEWAFGLDSGESFIVKDVTGGNLEPFVIEQAAPTDSFRIDNLGRIGLATTNPDAPFHMNVSGSGGLVFRMQNDVNVWDIGFDSGEDFIIRDVTDSNANIIELQNGAGGGALYIKSTGLVGIGSTAPVGQLHSESSGSTVATLLLKGAASQSADLIRVLNSAGTEKWDVDQEGIIDFQGTMGNSALDPTTDAPADWVEVEIGGTNYFLPAYAAS